MSSDLPFPGHRTPAAIVLKRHFQPCLDNELNNSIKYFKGSRGRGAARRWGSIRLQRAAVALACAAHKSSAVLPTQR